MRASLSLQRSLYRRQQREIGRSLAHAPAAFRKYERRYRAQSARYERVLTPAEVHAQVRCADVVYVGDYHTLRQAQVAYLELVHAALASGRRVVLALELVEGRHQASLDAFQKGKLSERAFLRRIGHPYQGPFDIWPHFAPILELARERRLDVVAIDRRAPGPRSLQVRDNYASGRVAQAAAAADRPLVLVLMGQFHVAPGHLPRLVKKKLGRTARSPLVVFQNAEGVYWRLAERGLADRAQAVQISDGVLCLINASPVVCQRSFLDYVEAESGDAPVEEAGVKALFAHLARAVGRAVGVDVGKRAAAVEVATAADLEPLERLRARGPYSRAEWRHLERHVLSRESAYLPRARMAWIASLSLNHLAEEAAHFVRHAAVGAAMEAPRTRSQAFWARCLEEALGFFGSKLANPTRRCVTLEEWGHHFHHGTLSQRRVAAFVLALSAADLSEPQGTERLLPLSSLELFHGVSHALGYLLGDALFRAFERGDVSKAQLGALFRDALGDPQAQYAALARRLFSRRAPGRAAAA